MVGHLPALRRYALGLTRDRYAADDLVQDCIELALRGLDTLVDEQRLAAWLRSILFKTFISGRRRTRRQGETVEAGLDELVDPATMPDERQEANEVLRATAALTPKYRQVLLLVAVEGLSYKEVAEELGVPVGTVMSRLVRAREQLRNALTERPSNITAFQGRLP
jgi:RNA polymerase sigma-70 factor, ECF subfamily